VVVLPLVGMADWGLGHALDSEETVLTHLLREACRNAPQARKPLVVPPLRFAFGADRSCAFAVDQPAAHALIAEVAVSVAASGFRRIAILNSSPWNEELCSAAARDLRVSRGLQMFQINLSALGLDFHPTRSGSRRELQTLLTALTGSEPEDFDGSPQNHSACWGEEQVTALPGPALALDQARVQGAALLANAAAHLARLLCDAADRPPLGATATSP